jgi:uncharacterized repeat protein (TIGR03803 family)
MKKFSVMKMVGMVFVFCAATAIASLAQTFTSLASFDYTNGAYPQYGPLIDVSGYLYGTTEVGGANGLGTVFSVSPDGAVTTLYSFCSQANCPDGFEPLGGLVEINGSLFGTTAYGGANNYGTVFEVDLPNGNLFATLHSFDYTDGAYPYAGLTYYGSVSGLLFGTTTYGGANGNGTVFQIIPALPYTLTTLYNFCSQLNCTDGNFVYSALTGAKSELWGTTYSGGASGFGTIFRITISGALQTVHSFAVTDGAGPIGGLVYARNGDFYGTTAGGGSTYDGTAFEMTPEGTLTTLYNFCAGDYCPDGVGPEGTLIQAANGDFFGTTVTGGVNLRGTVFEMTAAGKLTTLHSFAGPDGASPVAGLVQVGSTLYGTTLLGGGSSACPGEPVGCGTVFSLAAAARSK